MTKEQYVLNRTKMYIDHKFQSSVEIDPQVMADFMVQWEFDYEMDKVNNPNLINGDYKQEFRYIKTWGEKDNQNAF